MFVVVVVVVAVIVITVIVVVVIAAADDDDSDDVVLFVYPVCVASTCSVFVCITLINYCNNVIDTNYLCLQYQMTIHQFSHPPGSVITVGNKVIHAITLARR